MLSMTLQNDLYRVVHKTVRAQQVVEQHKVGGSKVGLNECPFQPLREGYRKDTKTNKRKAGQERSSMQQADYHRHLPTP